MRVLVSIQFHAAVFAVIIQEIIEIRGYKRSKSHIYCIYIRYFYKIMFNNIVYKLCSVPASRGLSAIVSVRMLVT